VENVTLYHQFSVETQVNLTLLVDLDDTLLGNDFTSFLPYYLEAFSRAMAPFVEPKILIPSLLSATQKMIENVQPTYTLKQVFEEAFFPAISTEPLELHEAIDSFYKDIFPTLCIHTHPKPEAIRLVEQAKNAGHRIAIATNPLFPLTAIQERLAWAGIAQKDYYFCVITSYETFHFAKPNPAYFAEILAQMGWPKGGVVMIGDNLEDDIIASGRLGLPAYWISTQEADHVIGPEAPIGIGSLADCVSWLESVPAETLQPNFNSSEALIAILSATPAALDTMTAGLSEASWVSRPEDDEWSLTEILCHLRDVDAEVNLPRIQLVMTQPNPFITGKDTDPWAKERHYMDQDGRTALTDFINARLRLLDVLHNLTQDDWNRTARHAILGPTNIKELVNIIAGHDQLHLRQIYELLSNNPHVSKVLATTVA